MCYALKDYHSFDLWTYKRPFPLPPHILTWVCGGGGGTGSDVIIRTAALLSVEYHHSISLRTNTPSGRTLFTILLHTPSADSEETCAWNDVNCRSKNIFHQFFDSFQFTKWRWCVCVCAHVSVWLRTGYVPNCMSIMSCFQLGLFGPYFLLGGCACNGTTTQPNKDTLNQQSYLLISKVTGQCYTCRLVTMATVW